MFASTGSPSLGGFLHAAGLSNVTAKRLSGGGQAIVRGVAG